MVTALGAVLHGLSAEVAVVIVAAVLVLSHGDALHGLVVDARSVWREGDASHGAEGLPRHPPAHPVIVECVAGEAHAPGLVEEAATRALFARVDVDAYARHHLSVRRLLRVDAARTVDTRLGGLEPGRVEGGILKPLNLGHLGGATIRLCTTTPPPA